MRVTGPKVLTLVATAVLSACGDPGPPPDGQRRVGTYEGDCLVFERSSLEWDDETRLGFSAREASRRLEVETVESFRYYRDSLDPVALDFAIDVGTKAPVFIDQEPSPDVGGEDCRPGILLPVAVTLKTADKNLAESFEAEVLATDDTIYLSRLMAFDEFEGRLDVSYARIPDDYVKELAFRVKITGADGYGIVILSGSSQDQDRDLHVIQVSIGVWEFTLNGEN